MGASVIGKSLNMGYPGNVSRNDPRTLVMNRPVKTAVIPFGVPVKLNTDNTYSPLTSDDTFAVFAGVALRNVKQQTLYASNATGQYEINEGCDVLEQGFVTVLTNASNAVTSGGDVYATFNSDKSFKQFDSSTATGAIKLTNCRWASNVQDGNAVAELAIITANEG